MYPVGEYLFAKTGKRLRYPCRVQAVKGKKMQVFYFYSLTTEWVVENNCLQFQQGLQEFRRRTKNPHALERSVECALEAYLIEHPNFVEADEGTAAAEQDQEPAPDEGAARAGAATEQGRAEDRREEEEQQEKAADDGTLADQDQGPAADGGAVGAGATDEGPGREEDARQEEEQEKENEDTEVDVSTSTDTSDDTTVEEPPRKKVRVRAKNIDRWVRAKEEKERVEKDNDEPTKAHVLHVLRSMPVIPDDDTDFFFEDNAVFIAGKGGWKLGERDPEEREDPRDREFLDSYIEPVIKNVFSEGQSVVSAARCLFKLRAYGCPIGSPLLDRPAEYFKEENREDIVQHLCSWLARLVQELREIRLAELNDIDEDLCKESVNFCKKSKTKRSNIRDIQTDKLWEEGCSLAIIAQMLRMDDVAYSCPFCASMAVRISDCLKTTAILDASRLKKWSLYGQPVTVNRKRPGFSCDAIGFTRLVMSAKPTKPSGEYGQLRRLEEVRAVGSHCLRCVLLVTEQEALYLCPIACLTRVPRLDGEPGSVKGSRAQLKKLTAEAQADLRGLHPDDPEEAVQENAANRARILFQEQRRKAIRQANLTKIDLKYWCTVGNRAWTPGSGVFLLK